MSFNTGVSIVPEFHMRRITPELNMLIGKSSFLELGYSYAIDPLYYSKSNNIKTKFQPGRPFSSWRIGIRLQQPLSLIHISNFSSAENTASFKS